MYFGAGAFANNAYAVDGVLEGLTLGVDLTYLHTFAGGNVTTVETPYPCFGTTGLCDQVGGPSTASDSFTWALTASLSPIEKLTVDTSMTFAHRFGRGLADATAEVGGMDVVLTDDTSHIRNSTTFAFGVGYDFDDWINVSGGWTTLTSRPNPEGANPIINSLYTVWSLTATVTVDQLYTSLRGAPPEVQEQAQQEEEGEQAPARVSSAPSRARAW
jgi:hypothetical protein